MALSRCPLPTAGLLAVAVLGAACTPAAEERSGAPPVGLAAMSSIPETYLASDAGRTYRFLVMGHVYGAHEPKTSGLFPPLAAALREDTTTFDFAVLTGDCVRIPAPPLFDALDQDLAALGLPVFIAPGNHDSPEELAAQGEDWITRRYGARTKSWRVGPDAYVTCDSVLGGGNLTAEDLAHIEDIAKIRPLRSLFVFVHHLVWLDRTRVANGHVTDLTNYIGAGYADQGNFAAEVLPRLRRLRVPVFVIAGDVGATSPVIQSYERVADNVHVMTSGMGEHAGVGTYLDVEVDPRGVRFHVRELGEFHGQPPGVLAIPSDRFRYSLPDPPVDFKR